MGQEIETNVFSYQDFSRFQKLLEEETYLLERYFQQGLFQDQGYIGGFELEAWLINKHGKPEPINQELLRRLDDPMIVPELAAFNLELNTEPETLCQYALRNMENKLSKVWKDCRLVAADLGVDLMMIGILPSIEEHELSLAHMSQLKRYKALNEQVLKMRNGRPLHLDIEARDQLQTTHSDVMLEAASTSFQIHMQMPLSESARIYNCAIALSAPMVAMSANSPFLFSHDLWDETRIPLFEQSVEVGPSTHRRVTFGEGYVNQSLIECFFENLQCYPVLVPLKDQDDPSYLTHLRFHNGTIWRWNRPLIGFGDDNKPHLRIEHRVMPSGPTIVDNIANAAFFYGLAVELGNATDPIERDLPFDIARRNFYECAKHGLQAQIHWPGRDLIAVRELLLGDLLPVANRGLEKLKIDRDDIHKYLDIIENRVETGQNGACWQRRWIEHYGIDFQKLTLAYLERQHQGEPVHTWTC